MPSTTLAGGQEMRPRADLAPWTHQMKRPNYFVVAPPVGLYRHSAGEPVARLIKFLYRDFSRERGHPSDWGAATRGRKERPDADRT